MHKPKSLRSILTLAAAALALGTALPTAAGAATIDVEVKGDFSGNNANGCALREAVRSANEGTSIGGCDAGDIGPDTIRIPAGTYPLTIDGIDNGTELGDLDVSDQLTIVGLGKGATVDGGGSEGINDRIFDLRLGDVKMRNVTVQGGRTTQGAGYHGAGILGDDSVSIDLRDVELLDNDGNGPSVRGGGISAEGPLKIVDSVVSGNNSPFYGGIDATGSTVIRRTTISGNDAAFGSGGMLVGGDSRISDSTFTGNELTSETGTQNGAAAVITDDSAFRNVTVAGNLSQQGGGGFSAVSGAEVALTNVTVTQNTADSNQDNTNPGDGGGLYSSNGGVFLLRNTVVSGNFDLTPQGDGDIEPDCAAQVALLGDNLIGNTDGCATQKIMGTPAEIADGSDPLLGELAMNGGPTATISFKKASPLLNRIKPPDCNDGGVTESPEITKDQRGVPRPTSGRCDVGAYERANCGQDLVNRVGTGSAERLKGTGGQDGLLALGGKDRLIGGGAGDSLCGGGGKDKLVGGPGADKLIGGPGKDVCVGGPGKDVTVGCEKVL